MALTDRDRAILDFERSWWQTPEPKAVAIRERFQLSPARYYRLLGALVSTPEAARYDPLVVHRVRRVQARRRRARIGGRPAVQPRGR